MAIGILAVGLLMAAVLFPAAIKENQNAFNNSMGSLICENGLTALRGKLKHEELTVTPATPNVLDAVSTTLGSRNFLGDDALYPSGDAAASMGYTGLLRKLSADANDYELTLISYNRMEKNSEIKAPRIQGALADYTYPASEPESKFGVTSKFTPAPATEKKWFQRNAVIVLVSQNGAVLHTCRVVRVVGNDVILDRKLTPATPMFAYPFAEVKKSDGEPLAMPSPAMSMLTARVAL